MSMFRTLAIAGAALVLTAFQGQSADLGHGRGSMKDSYVHHAPSGCPTWYARLDGGFATFDRPRAVELGVDDYIRPTIQDSWSIGGGIGRYLSCNVRADLTVDHRFDSEFKGDNGNPDAPVFGTHKFGYESTAVLLNFYYDFDTRSRFTPYIGVGFGVAHNQINAGTGQTIANAATGNAVNPIAISGAEKWSMAGALMTGFSVAMRERMKLDAGYRFLYLGDANTGDIRNSVTNGVGGKTDIDHLHAHEFRIGLRYDIR